MARLPRFVLPGRPQYVIPHGDNRNVIFTRQPAIASISCGDYKTALRNPRLHTYGNHVQLLLTPQTENGIDKLMQMLGRYYVQYYNFCYQRGGILYINRV